MRGAHCIANGIRLHYLDFDPGEAAVRDPLMLLPGITSPAATWAFVARRLAVDRRVVVPDMRGRGLSENRPGLAYGLDDYAADIAGLVAAIGLGRHAMLGHSMGARVAARLGTRAGADRILLADPPLSGPGRAPYPTPLSSYLAAHAAASQGASIADFRALTPNWSEEQIALRLEWLPTCGIEAITETHRNFHAEDVFGDFACLRCRTLLLVASKARVVTTEAACEVMASLRCGRLAAIDTGHMMPWDDLEAFLAAVQRLLDGPRGKA